MKIFLLNPNTTKSFTVAIDEIAQNVKNIDSEILCLNPSTGPLSIESDYDEVLSVKPCLDIIIPRQDEFDALVVACYGNHPLINVAREILHQPVLGIMEASLHVASMLGHSYSIITSGERAVTMFWRGVQALGLQAQCSSIRSTNTSVLALEGNNRFFVQKMILAEAKKAILEDNAEVISLGCAGMVGLADQMSDELGVPVIDSVVAGVKVAEALVGCGLTTSKQRAYLAPEKKELIGMPSYFSNPSNRQ